MSEAGAVLGWLVRQGLFDEVLAHAALGDETAAADGVYGVVDDELEGAEPPAPGEEPDPGLGPAARWAAEASDADVAELIGLVRRSGGSVKCSLCGRPVPAATAHRRGARHVGDECCWARASSKGGRHAADQAG